MSCKILVVDDEPANLRILERLFRADYTVFSADSGGEALGLLGMHDISVIISDQRMPVMTGIDFLKKAAETRPQTVRIILTGYTDVNALVEAINSGVVYKYVTKPWNNEDLRQTVKKALQHHETIKAQHRLGRENERMHLRSKTMLEVFVKIVARMLDLKKPGMYSHVRRTGDYALAVGQHLNLPPIELEQISTAALLHEYPHLNIPNQILFKAGELSEAEQAVFIHHFERELQMLAGVPDLEDIASVIRSAHERYDGKGFPDKLIGEQIPLHARIVAVADAFDELTSTLHSQEGLTLDAAVEHLKSFAGEDFDPEIIEIFGKLNSNGQIHAIKASGETG